MISVLSLVVAILAVFFGPLVTWEVTRQQIRGAVREAWMRDFREKVSEYLTGYGAYRDNAGLLREEIRRAELAFKSWGESAVEARRRLANLYAAMARPHNAILLLIAEQGNEYVAFIEFIERVKNISEESASEAAAASVSEFTEAAVAILQRERAAIEADPGMWRALRNRLGTIGWQPLSRLVAWCRGPPRPPT